MIGRREFITLLRGAAAWPVEAVAQQPAMPVVGLLHPTSIEAFADNLRGFRQGLKETGYVEGENVAFQYRWADGQVDRLPELAADLVRRRVAVIATASPPAAFAAETSRSLPSVTLRSRWYRAVTLASCCGPSNRSRIPFNTADITSIVGVS